MSDVPGSAVPRWVTKRDGRLEAFDADKICQALFTATEALGEPNAFLARELTDAVVHFLDGELTEPAPPTREIAAQVAKVVRELGQPALAQAYAASHVQPVRARRAPGSHSFTFSVDEAPAELVRRCLRAYAERAVFSRDLVSAQGDGLLFLAGLDTPQALASAVVDWPLRTVGEPWAGLGDELVGQGLVVNGPEWFANTVSDLPHLLTLGGRRSVVVNLNAAEPPAAARQRPDGPLFAEEAPSEPELDRWLEAMEAYPSLRWHWHVQARDFAGAPERRRLLELARRALAGAGLAFVFDRPRRPLALAEGIDRQHPAVLLEVGLDLAAFLRFRDIEGSIEACRLKLPSLARMAVSAGAQKRKYLRRHAGVTQRGFLLDRARLAVVPLGLNAVVQALAGHEPAGHATALNLARELIQHLHDALQTAGRAVHLEVGVDSPGPGLRELLTRETRLDAGPSCATRHGAAGRQLSAAGALHAITGQGTALAVWPNDAAPSPEELVELLHTAWRRTELVRVAFRAVEPASLPQQALPGRA